MKQLTTLVLIVLTLPVASCQANGSDKILFTVQRSGNRPFPANENAVIVLPWVEILKRFPSASSLSPSR